MTNAGTARLAAALAAAGISWDLVSDSCLFTGGTFNTVYQVSLADGTRLVVKLPPAAGTPHPTWHQPAGLSRVHARPGL